MPTTTDQPPGLDGELRFDQDSRAAAADDFGHVVRRAPEAVLLPASARDVAESVRWAARRCRGFAAQGRRHSTFGRGQAAGGVVADMTRLRTVRDPGPDRVVVDAGASWRDVLAATLPHGRRPPALPDYLDLSVGGTLAVGGIGGAVSRFGLASDNVLDLQVVTGRGEVLTCSPNSHADLFDAVRAGLGQVAVVTRATLALVPAPQQVRRYRLCCPDLPAMLADQRLLAGSGRFDAVQGAVLPAPAGGWTYRIEAVGESDRLPDGPALPAGLSGDRSRAETATLPYLEHADRLAALERTLRASGQWFLPHPWLATFVGGPAVERVVGAELARLTAADLGPAGQVVLSPVRRRSVRSPLARLPADELCFAVNLVRNPATADRSEVDRLLAGNRATYDRVRAAGGTLYPVSALPMSAADWRDHFGPAFGRLRDAKQAYDPDHVLTPGYEVFADSRPRSGAGSRSA